MSIETLYQLVDDSRKSWEETYGLLVSGKYDTTGVRPAIGGMSIDQLNRRVTLLFETFSSIKPESDKSVSWIVMSGRTTDAVAALTSLKNHADGINNQVRPHMKDEVTIRDVNGNFHLNFVLNEAGISSFDLNNFFSHIHAASVVLLSSVSIFLPLCDAKYVSDLSLRAQRLSEVIREAETLRNDARKAARATEQSANSAAANEKFVQDLLSKAETSLSQLQALQSQGNTDAGSVAALIEKIKSIGSNAETLEKQVDGYKSSFDAFQAALDKRTADFLQFEEDSKVAEHANNNRTAEIDRLTILADAMISGATTAGLATSMESARSRYETRMNGARKGFYFAVVLLVVSSIPLVGHLLPGLISEWFPAVDFKADSGPYAALSKVLLLLPATWLTAFFTKSYADFFHLEREYAHKAALAMSVDGFKRQAQKYEEEITAEVFMEIRMNPAKRLNVEPAAHPLYNVLSNAVSKVLDRKDENIKG